MHLSRRHFLIGATTTCGAALCGCTANPATGRSSFTAFQSVEQDIAIGRREHPKLLKAFGGVYEDRRLQSYVDRIGKRLAAVSEMPDLPYTFTIANSPVVNAFALPGGPVTVTRGLLALCDSEAELAGVIGHEIGHVTARHSAERQGQQLLASLGLAALAVATGSRQVTDVASFGAQAFLRSYSRSQELEADTLGARYLDRANYDVDAMESFLRTLGEQSRLEASMLGLEDQVDEFNMMATHPRTVERVQAARRLANAIAQEDPVVRRTEYLDSIDGLMFGDDPEQGMVLGRRFVHPVLRFEFTVPEGFRLINGESKVLARDRDGNMIVFDMARHGYRDMRDYIAREWAAEARLYGLEAIEVDGMEAATAAARGTVNNRPMDIRLVAIRKDSDEVYRFMFVTVPGAVDRLGEPLRRTTYSFRRLSPEEAARIEPLRIRIVNAVPGTAIAELAKGFPYGRWNKDWFRVLNDLGPGETLAGLERVKIVA